MQRKSVIFFSLLLLTGLLIPVSAADMTAYTFRSASLDGVDTKDSSGIDATF